MSPEETPLLARVAAGEPGAVRACLDRFGGLVWSLCRRRCATDSEAEDAVQDIFLDVWQSASRYDPEIASETAFVAMIARRRLIDRQRRSSRRPKPYALGEGGLEPSGGEERDLDRTAPEVLDEATRAANALRRLSPEQQRVLQLSVYHGLSHEKISRATGLPLGTVKTHARRGLIRLRELLADRPHGAEAEPNGSASETSIEGGDA
ncbi:MAG: sigma-70 family RNA polymerase sigma factor [Planctomycetota bacterium]